MKYRLCLLFLFTIVAFAQCQQLDSIKYEYGYLYYRTYGAGDPVILLSGGPGNASIQAHPVATEIGKKYRCILFEQRGTGRSIPLRLDSTTINLKSALGDLELLMQHLELKEATFAGHSWGGTLAMSFAAAHPGKVNKLILIAPGSYKDWQGMFDILQVNMRARLGVAELRRLDGLNEKIEGGKFEPEEFAEARKLLRSTYIYDRQAFDTLSLKMDVPANAHMRVLMNKDVSENLDLTNALPRYKGPIHIISGRQDILAFSAYEIKILMPSANLHWIDACGHFPFLEKPQAFYQILFDVLREN